MLLKKVKKRLANRKPITTGAVVIFILHNRLISISRSSYLDSFSVTFTEVFQSVGMDMSLRRLFFFFFVFNDNISSVCFYLTIVCIGMSHRIIVSFPSDTICGLFSYHLSFLLNMLNSLQIFQCTVGICGSLVVSMNVFRLG